MMSASWDEAPPRRWVDDPWAAWSLGVGLPCLVLFLDRGVSFGGFLPWRPYSSILMLVCMAALWTSLVVPSHGAARHALLLGPLLVGAVFALTVGILLLPLTLPGLAMVIGVLGLSPFVTGYVFHRALRRSRASASAVSRSRRWRLGAAGAVFTLTFVAVTGDAVTRLERRATDVLMGRAPGDAARAERTLRTLWWFPQVRLTEIRESAGVGEDDEGRDVWERITEN